MKKECYVSIDNEFSFVAETKGGINNQKTKLIRSGGGWASSAEGTTACKIKDSGNDLSIKVDGIKFTLDYAQAEDVALAIIAHYHNISVHSRPNYKICLDLKEIV